MEIPKVCLLLHSNSSVMGLELTERTKLVEKTIHGDFCNVCGDYCKKVVTHRCWWAEQSAWVKRSWASAPHQGRESEKRWIWGGKELPLLLQEQYCLKFSHLQAPHGPIILLLLLLRLNRPPMLQETCSLWSKEDFWDMGSQSNAKKQTYFFSQRIETQTFNLGICQQKAKQMLSTQYWTMRIILTTKLDLKLFTQVLECFLRKYLSISFICQVFHEDNIENKR